MTSCFRDLSSVQKPYQYVGQEENAYNKDFVSAAARICIAFPDAYEIGMANVGMQIIYHTLNEQPDFMADRVYAPLVDMGALLKSQGAPLLARESQRPLRDFDCVGFTLQYELCYTNLLYMLDLAQIPLRAKDRKEGDPLICAGGPCVFNPEPIADFLDFVVVGEGEEVILEVADVLADARRVKKSRAQTIEMLGGIKGVYVPSWFSPEYGDHGNFLQLKAIHPSAPRWVERRIIADLDKVPYPTKPVTASIKPVHDRISVEIQRGCTRGCRFCQAGYIYRPRRERNPKRVVEIIEESIKNTGNYDIGLLSLSSADYGNIHPVMRALMDRYKKQHLSVSLPSTRLEALKEEYLDVLKEERRTGFTIAPEAGSQRMRNVINKNFTEEEVIATVKMLFSNGWQNVKLYFMIGLPTETDEDVKAIAELGNAAYRAVAQLPGRKNITISVSNFVPKPHTPFQWHEQISHSEILRKQSLVRNTMAYPRNMTFRSHSANLSFAEGIVARGDRRAGALIERAFQLGAKFDCWQELFNLDLWKTALGQIKDETGIDLAEQGVRSRSFDEVLPWHRVYCGIHPKFFKNEFNKAVYGIATEDCSFASCTECGLCNEHTGVQPIVQAKIERLPDVPSQASPESLGLGVPIGIHSLFRFQYQRIGSGVFVSPTDLQAIILRSFKRSDIQTVYDQGMRPRPKLSMGPALPVGVASRCELFDIVLETNLTSQEIMERVNQYLPTELKVLTVTALDKDDGTIASIIRSQSFQILTSDLVDLGAAPTSILEVVAKLRDKRDLLVKRSRKNKYGHMETSEVNLTHNVAALRTLAEPNAIEFSLIADNGQHVSPYLIVEAILGPENKKSRQVQMTKTGFATL